LSKRRLQKILQRKESKEGEAPVATWRKKNQVWPVRKRGKGGVTLVVKESEYSTGYKVEEVE